MTNVALPPPGLRELEEAARDILRNFNGRSFAFLSAKGEWRENPKTLRDRAVHEILFELTGRRENGFGETIQNIFLPFTVRNSWSAARKIASASAGSPAFLIILEALAWIIDFEVLKLNSACFAPAWDQEANSEKRRCFKELEKRRRFFNSILAPEEEKAFSASAETIKSAIPQIIPAIARLLADEEIFNTAIARLLGKSKTSGLGNEALSLISEKIQPPEGVVTKTSPALLRPCLRLLVDAGIDPASGVPYHASMILSILKDPRSRDGLLKALNETPVTNTKIRENIIYTLGILKEGRAVQEIARVLDQPDEILASARSADKSYHPLLEQKEEAIWALGKISPASARALPALAVYADHSSLKLRTYLAWTLGEIGKAQKEESGGVSAEVVIALLKLLKTKNKQVFEESVSALKKIGMPEFVHALYFYHVGAISILGLKPAQRGLYELSETLHYLMGSKKPIIMAVNGDSGTGKTYFCQAILSGFGGVNSGEILYLMRDRKRGQKVFNRILGIKWLKKYIDPAYYDDYPLSEEEDDPDEYFRRFLAEQADKKLIILDGARDSLYFQKVIDYFYVKGALDVDVNFRANFSTRRLNLEEREMALESVKTHLAFLEEPTLEDTLFYQEGIEVLYDLDNSVGARLNAQEIKELFETQKIQSWGDMIKLGDFKQTAKPLKVRRQRVTLKEEDFSFKRRAWKTRPERSFTPEERNFKAETNADLAGGPNLLQTIELGDLKAGRIRFYAQDQIAGIGEGGRIFILTFLDNRIFETALDHVTGIALLGRDIYVVANERELIRISFERSDIARVAKTDSAILKIVSQPRHRIITGHADGSIRVWDTEKNESLMIEGKGRPVAALAADYAGRIYSADAAGGLRRWDIERKTALALEIFAGNISHLRLYPDGKILGAGDDLMFLNFDKNEIQAVSSDFNGNISSLNVYFDGRIIAGLSAENVPCAARGENLIIVSGVTTSGNQAGSEFSAAYQVLGGHGLETKDCLTMGPKIVSCGREETGRHSLRIWGTEFFVHRELAKLAIRPA